MGIGALTMMGLWRWKCTMQATSALVAGWNMACRMFLQGHCKLWRGVCAHCSKQQARMPREAHPAKCQGLCQTQLTA